ncbi:aromatic ring-hydroxylating dioxygenase subunit alpha [Frankia sp. CNm7]|uniref:cholesterol 7-desaturase n=1 Tax=Frankia nepalensis TaxID=1836974 RepID=A0A937URA9_9ACTN|nr:Rieske 2Fe-2S domain-containing protein [Frankia nepalensis]MBL7499768.1 aromatic ring-hydroxylating dioxygenase subunit alpha [Frankia nepalensis]MBL7512253.1 aromatic ring-hydroxylating dioxygenase subunit alpha [Frankia nepalensis]MBL7524087.1 aromatic ring-hydroxylating dioxygenase subunit alpha [Frankia nepalensis]MBL7629055.1 aromatic ring-hydroxylating dioxygenase subunit alpha [Frankia nepalensis]
MTISGETRASQPGPAGVYGTSAVAATATEDLVGLPMPQRPDTLYDLSRRTRVRRESGPRFPFPIPNGWFVVARADEIEPGRTKSLFYFGKDLVLFRGTDGTPYLFDAYCPHLGANLGVGGKVVDGSLQCPFHGWRFDGASGACVEVPYDDNPYIPKTATARSYPVVERNHMIWAWHHLEGSEPFYEVPEVPEFHDDDWLPIVVKDFEIATCCQEMAENNVDTPHFVYVHGTPAIPEEEFHVYGYFKRTVGMDGNFVREGFGLGLAVLRVKGYTTFVSSTTPIDEENVHVRWIFTSPRALGENAAEDAASSFTAGISQDLPIWENKIFKDPPVLRPSEKAVTEQRRWCQQFYSWPKDDQRRR